MTKNGSRASGDAIQVAEIVAFFEEALSRPPSETGKLLRSERDFAALLGVHRMKIHRALDVLMENGILTRRQGSGTFVRKVPAGTGRGGGAVKWGGRVVPSTDLFAGPAKALVRKQASRENRRLKLHLVTCWDSETTRSITAGIRDRAKQEGHDLKIYPLGVQENDPEVREALVNRLRTEPVDGCMVWTFYNEVITEAFGEKLPPIVYIGGATRKIDLSYEPLIRTDVEDATARALTHLSEAGYKRIGFIGCHSELRNAEECNCYNDVMRGLGTRYRSMSFCPLEDDEGTLAAMRRMFSDPNRPDAVYVADDIILRQAARAWKQLGLVPGKNLGVITLSNRSNSLPAGFAWSCMEFHPFQVGRMVLDSLLLEIQTAGEVMCSFEHLAAWRPGATHLRA